MTEPQQADASPLLDLVRQYGDAIGGVVSAGECGGPDDVWGFEQEAQQLLARIAALVPQQPVQARDEGGWLWWIHGCGHVDGAQTGLPDECCDSGPWRPLLVGGDPAPERTPPTHDDFKRLAGIKRGDRHEPHVVGPREPSAEERADHELMTALGVERIEEVMPAIERLKAAQPDPLVLSLPEVPEGTVALVDRHKRRWTLSEMTDLAADDGRRLPLWESRFGVLRTYPALLAGSGPLTVDLAPHRAPRTAAAIWRELDEDDRAYLHGSEFYGELKAALDREAGL